MSNVENCLNSGRLTILQKLLLKYYFIKNGTFLIYFHFIWLKICTQHKTLSKVQNHIVLKKLKLHKKVNNKANIEIIVFFFCFFLIWSFIKSFHYHIKQLLKKRLSKTSSSCSSVTQNRSNNCLVGLLVTLSLSYCCTWAILRAQSCASNKLWLV